MLDFRPVDCYTKQPFANFLPGYVNETIYGDRVETGWSYNVYGSDQNQFALAVGLQIAVRNQRLLPQHLGSPPSLPDVSLSRMLAFKPLFPLQ